MIKTNLIIIFTLFAVVNVQAQLRVWNMKNLDEAIEIIKKNSHRNYLIIREKKYYDFEELLSFQRDLQGSSKTLQGYKIKFIDYLSMRRALIILLQEKYYTYKSYDEVQIELSQLENNAKSRFIIRNRDMRNFKTPQDIHPKDPCSHYEDDIDKKKHYRIALEILTRLNLLDETDLKVHRHFKSIYEDISNC